MEAQNESRRSAPVDHLGITGDDYDGVHAWVWTLGNDRRVTNIARGIQAWQKLRNQQNGDVQDMVREVTFIPEGPVAKLDKVTTQLPCHAELDFTIGGKQGDLTCPFATRVPVSRVEETMAMPYSQGYQRRFSLPTPPHPNQHFAKDPIAAELQATDFVSPPPSANGSASKCPIRFLDQHSPEEVAKYFENHKHEIPRSHEICVKRYQSNSESIRELDAKYGSLVNMIQGLGMKHQPLLSTKEEEEEEGAANERQSIEKVEKWAASYSNNPAAASIGRSNHDGLGEDRTGHFDRRLKEIRVGESPSRPWGISVPFSLSDHMTQTNESDVPDLKPAVEHELSEPELPRPQHQSSVSDVVPPQGKCPFDPRSLQGHHSSDDHRTASPEIPPSEGKERSASKPKAAAKVSKSPPHMLFTGPVFIGYSAEQAQDLMQECFQNMNLAKN